ncbi:MAG: hypothetical protein ACKV2Q_20345, partial [Planctomycetaceae bacterium]
MEFLLDSKFARVIVVLSDETSFALLDDPYHEMLVWVGDLTKLQAHAYFDMCHFLSKDGDSVRRAMPFDCVGTRIAD